MTIGATVRKMLYAFLMITLGGFSLAASGSEVSGPVRFEGEVPDQDIADNAGRRRALLQVNAESQGLADVVLKVAPPVETPGRSWDTPIAFFFGSTGMRTFRRITNAIWFTVRRYVYRRVESGSNG